jgi:hypothetical protein
MLVSEESCSLPYFTNTYAPPSSGMAIQFPQPKKGMGCAGKQDCGCGCSQGMSNYLPLDNPVSSMRLTSSNRVGLGLFDSADFTTWGVGEWGVVAFGLYAVFSIFSTTKRGVGKVRRVTRKSRARRKAALLREAGSL